MIISEQDHLEHIGTPRHSGRYPWGSGGNEAQQSKRNRDFLDFVALQRKQGLTDKQIFEGMGINSAQFRARQSIATNEQRQLKINTAQRLKDKGMSNPAIGRQMGINESSVRALLAPGAKDKAAILSATADILAKEVAEKKFVQVGSGVAQQLNINNSKLLNALALLKEQGYEVHTIPVPQVGTGKNTSVKVLANPGTTWGEVKRNQANIKLVGSWSDDGGRTYSGLQPPLSISSKRIAIRYAEQGGAKEDGVLHVRPGVEDVSIGNQSYAQVRVAVDNSHYIKGMAVYKNDLPPGIDIVFNTNKSDTGNKLDALKSFEDASAAADRNNPFGATIKRQILSVDKNGKEHVKSAMNIVNEEGDWDSWSRTLSAQTLSKQSPRLAKQQLDLMYDRKRSDLDEILSLTNPAVRKKLLESFADGADSSAVHLKAAALPRSSYHVILPINSIKSTEVYAPNFQNGERVVLIRYPHAGTFEIPELTVNNRNREAGQTIGKSARDAVGIHPDVAQKLSGADFDGDSVLVVPNNNGQIKHSPALDALKDFDPKAAFPPYEGMQNIGKNKQTEMGKITNLIADMSVKGAKPEEIARAVKHSMVVIDAEKHNLDYKGSFQQNNIGELKRKYQGRSDAGAATLITRAGSKKYIDERRAARVSEGGPIDPRTGKLVFVPTGRTYPERKKVLDPNTGKRVWVETGKQKPKQVQVKRLAVEDDAHVLSTGTKIESVYADHSNKMKALANEARKEMVNTKSTPYSPSAKAAYSNEVASLNASLNTAVKNRPLEKQAQIIANAHISQKRQANPDMDGDTLKKVKNQALADARARTGADKHRIQISPKEWEAIQAGAITNNKLSEILNNTDLDAVKTLATPRTAKLMTPSKISRAKAMAADGYTQSEIAQQLGVSLTTLKTSIGGD